MDKLYSPRTINDIKERHGFKFSKSLGQNFLTDKNIINKIIEGAAIGEDDLVIEIGPGVGVLTAEAAREASRVIAIEIDKNLIPILEETLGEFSNVEIINRDILKTDLGELLHQSRASAEKAYKSAKVIGNLPYYITTPIIMKILEENVDIDSITIMMQKEVADRIKAGPGSKTYGAISVAVQYYCTVTLVSNVPKEVFIPRPKVDSAVIRLDIRKEKPVYLTDEKTFFAVVKAGFGQRRKTLHNALTGVYGLTKEAVASVLAAAEIDPIRRAETLGLDEFARISNKIDERKGENINANNKANFDK